MIRKLLLGATLLLAGCNSQPTPPKPRHAEPALWVVKDADTTIYLFGTVHLLRPGLGWFDDSVKKAFDGSNELVLELVMPPEAQMQAIVSDLGTARSSPPLSDQLPPEVAKKLHAALSQLGMSPTSLDTSEPWLAAMTLSVLPLRQLGYDDKDGAEQVLTAAANQSGKKIEGLETAREQLGYFDKLSPPAQESLLETTLDDIPHASSDIDTMIKDWSAGNADALAKLINDDMDRTPELKQALLVTRNQHWADWIAKRMAQPGTVFLAVGAGHLAGSESVQAELAKRGLQATRVQ